MNKRHIHVSKHRTDSQIITRIYASQKRSSKKRKHPMPTYSKEELKDWLYTKTNFVTLYNEWVKNNYISGLIPSIDRIESSKPYTLDNIRLMTWMENNELGSTERRRPVLKFTLDGVFVKRYDRIMTAGEEHGDNTASMLVVCLKGKKYSYDGFIWMYESEYTKELLNIKVKNVSERKSTGQPRPVYLLDIKGNIIKEFISVTDVTNKTKLEDHIITRAAIGKHPTKSGMIFLYKDLYSNKEILNNLLKKCEAELDRRVVYIDDNGVEHTFSRPARLYAYLNETGNPIMISSLMYKLRCKNNKQFMYLKDL